jgi:hypothetical protein
MVRLHVQNTILCFAWIMSNWFELCMNFLSHCDSVAMELIQATVPLELPHSFIIREMLLPSDCNEGYSSLC